jgi:hypothetical protein
VVSLADAPPRLHCAWRMFSRSGIDSLPYNYIHLSLSLERNYGYNIPSQYPAQNLGKPELAMKKSPFIA